MRSAAVERSSPAVRRTPIHRACPTGASMPSNLRMSPLATNWGRRGLAPANPGHPRPLQRGRRPSCSPRDVLVPWGDRRRCGRLGVSLGVAMAVVHMCWRRWRTVDRCSRRGALEHEALPVDAQRTRVGPTCAPCAGRTGPAAPGGSTRLPPPVLRHRRHGMQERNLPPRTWFLAIFLDSQSQRASRPCAEKAGGDLVRATCRAAFGLS